MSPSFPYCRLTPSPRTGSQLLLLLLLGRIAVRNSEAPAFSCAHHPSPFSFPPVAPVLLTVRKARNDNNNNNNNNNNKNNGSSLAHNTRHLEQIIQIMIYLYLQQTI